MAKASGFEQQTSWPRTRRSSDFRVLQVAASKEVVGASAFEPPTSWSRTMNTNSINALSGVAYGTRSLVSPLLVVRSLSVDQRSGPGFQVWSPDLLARAFAVHTLVNIQRELYGR